MKKLFLEKLLKFKNKQEREKEGPYEKQGGPHGPPLKKQEQEKNKQTSIF